MFMNLFSSVFICFSPWSSIDFLCFSKACAKGEYVNLACSITLLWSEGSIPPTLRLHTYQLFQMIGLIFLLFLW